LNPNPKPPRLNIVSITRSDSSGTTWAFTNHLSTIGQEWCDEGPGTDKKVDWPGNSMAARYNEGAAAKIRHSWDSIGYVEYGIAKRAGLNMAIPENHAGSFVQPDDESDIITLARNSSIMPTNLRLFPPDPEGVDA
jgi:phosphate transport system substrate-binding protein